MFEATLIKEIFAVVFHPEGEFVDPRESAERVFVCGSLMDPAFLSGRIGRAAAMVPATARGHSRGWGEADGKRFHFLREDAEGTTQGMALLGLTGDDIRELEKFEQVPEVRRRADIEICVGDIVLSGITYLANK
ncbi:MAG TPA: gamma-glutamylcyclotransferase [bacterium]|nr:MAG: hypothetical protein BWY28_01991 [bacterium ADurb.Bin236]HOY62680.1 gamma-glutamylcyclotransferase [bacterium]HPI78281.1 gamma-glutamylcyclotransferase [bacterium]HPN93875.1 gamma-glutamylcyclotransferase [bacterium]